MAKRLLLILFLIAMICSGCAEDMKLINFDGNEITDVNLEGEFFEDIYGFQGEFTIGDIYLQNTEELLKGNHAKHEIEPSDMFEPLSALMGTQSLKTTVHDIVSHENRADYQISFVSDLDDANRRFHINVGDSFLLVSLIGETDQIIKHEIPEESYEYLIELLRMVPTEKEYDLSEVEGNLVRVTDKITLDPDDSGHYCKYLILHDEALNQIPVMVGIEADIIDKGKTAPVLESIENLRISVYGVNYIDVLGEYEDGNYYWEKDFLLTNDQMMILTDESNALPILFLESRFENVKVWENDYGTVSYTSNHALSNYNLTVGFGRDPMTEEIYLSVRDSGSD